MGGGGKGSSIVKLRRKQMTSVVAPQE